MPAPEDHTPPPNRPLAGGLMVLASALMFAVVSALARAASAGLPTEMVVFFRNAMAMAFLLPWLLARRGGQSLKTGCPHLHLLRGAAGLGAMYCFYYALTKLRLADAVLLNFTVPIFIPVFSRLWLREPAGPRIKLAVAVGFVGVALVIKPGLGVFQPAGLVGLASGMLAALGATGIRRMSTSEPIFRIVFYFTAFGTLVSSVPLSWSWQAPGGQLPGLLAIGILAALAQICLTKGFSMAPAGQVGAFSYGNVVFAALLGWVFWGETLDWLTLAGAVLTCAAGIIATYRREPKWDLAGMPVRQATPPAAGKTPGI